jgi:precorrin-6B methylase 2
MTAMHPDRNQILEMASGFRAACVVGAAAELDIFTVLGTRRLSAEAMAHQLGSDLRATRMLLDAVAALGLLDKDDESYTVPAALRPLLLEGSPQTVLPMVRHNMTILRCWSQLAWVVKSGEPAERRASIRGEQSDRASFVAAMHTVSGPVADDVVRQLQPRPFSHFLDVGGASGTWTLAFLRAMPDAQATLFDMPDAIEQARQRIAGTEFTGRVRLVAGDFYRDPLPAGADYAWLSAIIHQHSRQHNRELFSKVFAALQPGGRIGIRDLVMEPSRIRPAAGALFAINMLVNTETGGTFTLEEITEDLCAAGFVEAGLSVPSQEMNAVVEASKPG